MSSTPLRRLLVVATALAFLTSGCSASAQPSGTPTASAPDAEAGSAGEHVVAREMAEGMGASEPDGAFPRTVEHDAGSTKLETAPKRIAVVSTGQLDALLALGTVPVAATRAEASALVPAYLAEAFPERAEALDDLEDIGERTEPSLEAIAASEPDLILINSVRGAELFDRLSTIAPTVVTLGNGVNWKSDFLLLADALGMEGDAQDVLDGLHRDADAFAAGLDDAPTVSFLQSAGLRMRIMGLPSFTGGIAEDLGLGRPESQRFDETSQDLSPEQLQAADADWLFYAVEGDGAAALLEAPLWPSLGAVRGGSAVEVDLDPFFMNAGPVAARLAQDRIVDALG
ncbi:ABC transporter substrate-binding protein [Arenivirga flava]|uniref:ABC transporter substrate-binding protein n=1 Tax=Arenivirga flava TaxID=1930060 RepID=A0AA37XA26_9MICO|nr:iron-siderophore ABC transporter substrate-binding protein [Arenivirga flava]GMA29234.1 ABC transporter substrate-binding protein [Arenivirga flava]